MFKTEIFINTEEISASATRRNKLNDMNNDSLIHRNNVSSSIVRRSLRSEDNSSKLKLDVTPDNSVLLNEKKRNVDNWKMSIANQEWTSSLKDKFQKLEFHVKRGEDERQSLESKLIELSESYIDLKFKVSEHLKCTTDMKSKINLKDNEIYMLKKNVSSLKTSLDENNANLKRLETEKNSLKHQLHQSKKHYEEKNEGFESSHRQIIQLQTELNRRLEENEHNRQYIAEIINLKNKGDALRSILENELKAKDKELNNQIKQFEILTSTNQALENMNSILINEKEQYLKRIEKINCLLQNEKHSYENACSDLQMVKVKCEELMAENDAMISEIEDYKNQLANEKNSNEIIAQSNNQKLKELNDQIESLQNELKSNMNEKIENMNTINSLENTKNQLKSSNENLEKEVNNLLNYEKINSEKFMNLIESKENEIAHLKSSLEESKSSHDALFERSKMKEEECKKKITEIQELKNEIETLTAAENEAKKKSAKMESDIILIKKETEMQISKNSLSIQNHMKEISKRNNLAIEQMKKQYEIETTKVIEDEKNKTENLIIQIKRQLEEKSISELNNHDKSLQQQHESHIKKILEAHENEKSTLNSQINENEKKISELSALVKKYFSSLEILESEKIKILSKHEQDIKTMHHEHEVKMKELELMNKENNNRFNGEKKELEEELRFQETHFLNEIKKMNDILQQEKISGKNLENSRSELVEELKKQKKITENLTSEKKELSQTLSKLKLEKEKEMAALKQQHETEMKNLKMNDQKSIQSIINEHENDIRNLNLKQKLETELWIENHKKMVLELEKKHEIAVSELKRENEKEIMQLKRENENMLKDSKELQSKLLNPNYQGKDEEHIPKAKRQKMKDVTSQEVQEEALDGIRRTRSKSKKMEKEKSSDSKNKKMNSEMTSMKSLSLGKGRYVREKDVNKRVLNDTSVSVKINSVNNNNVIHEQEEMEINAHEQNDENFGSISDWFAGIMPSPPHSNPPE